MRSNILISWNVFDRFLSDICECEVSVSSHMDSGKLYSSRLTNEFYQSIYFLRVLSKYH